MIKIPSWEMSCEGIFNEKMQKTLYNNNIEIIDWEDNDVLV